jgi:hypothetical protein
MRHDKHKPQGGLFPLHSVGLMLLGGMLASGALLAIVAQQMGSVLLSPFQQLGSLLGGWFQASPPPAKVNVQSIVLQQVREVSDLTTAVFTMQAVVPTSQDAAVGNLVIGTTKLLYVAHGEVKAGVDLSQLSPANVQVAGEQIRIQLPPPQLLDHKIDVNRSRVYDYNRGWLGLGPDVAPTLQAQAQQEALTTIVAAACTDGILQRANERAKFVVTQLLKTSGYPSVIVESMPLSANSCADALKPQARRGSPTVD